MTESEEDSPRQSREESIIIPCGRAPSLYEEGLIEFGKSLFKGSIDQALAFHKTMLSLTATFTTLMASVFGLLTFGINNVDISINQRIFLVIPVLLMLLSSICFTIGYYPRYIEINMQILDTIREARTNLIKTRRLWATCGTILFTLAICSLIAGIIMFNIC